MKKFIGYFTIFLGVFALQLYVAANDLTGTDDQGAEIIEGEHEVSPIIPNPLEAFLNDTTETIFFAVQAALGVGLLAFALETAKKKRYTLSEEE